MRATPSPTRPTPGERSGRPGRRLGRAGRLGRARGGPPAPAPSRRHHPRHPDRPDPLATAATREAVALALLVAGPPARLPRRRPAALPAPGTGRRDRGGRPQRAAAQLRLVDQRLLRRRRLVRPRGAARRDPGAALGPPGARRDHSAAARRVERGRRRWDLVAARRRLQERPRQRPGGDPARPRRPRRAGGVDRRLDARHAAGPRDRTDPRRCAGGAGRRGARGRGHALHLLPGRPPGGVRGAGGRRRRRALDGPGRGAARRGRHTVVGADGVVPGYDDGGDGGLFNGILARLPGRRGAAPPGTRPRGRADRARERRGGLEGRLEVGGGPVFAQDWRRPARARARAGRRRTCRCSCRRGCCWRPRRRCSAPVDEA